MKRVRVYQQIIADDNLRLAIQEVCRSHRRNGDHTLNKKVLEIEANLDDYVEQLRKFIQDLVSGDAGIGMLIMGKGNGETLTNPYCGRTSVFIMQFYSL